MASSRPDPAATGRRLSAEARERQIVEGAIGYFAEVGLDGQTRELARRLGITQPLLFRYFPTKAALIERIYEEVYLKRWNAAWEATVRDPALPCLERFRRFEIDYQRTIDDYAWLRIFVSAGLKGFDLPARYLGLVRTRIFAPLLAAMRAEAGLPDPEAVPLGPDEFELLFGIHGALVYVGLRSRVYGIAGPADRDAVRAAMLEAALPGLTAAHRRVVEAGIAAEGSEAEGSEAENGIATADGSGADGSGADGSGADGSGADGSGADTAGPGARRRPAVARRVRPG